MNRFNKKRSKLVLGAYPNVTLEAARRKAEEASENIANGIDPNDIKKNRKKKKNEREDASKISNKRKATKIN